MMKLILFLLIAGNVFADENYLARFKTLNPHINGTLSGSATIFFDNDKIKSFVRLFAGYPDTWHMQNIYVGKRCPVQEDDLNLDGFIDITEAHVSSGKIIIPLDADIHSQMAGFNTFPVADIFGSYLYDTVAWKTNFFNDLKSADPDPQDHITKLGWNENLNLEGKVIIIQGVPDTVYLPETVASFDGRTSQQTLPIACGIFKRTL